MTASEPASNALIVEFIGTEHVVEVDSDLTFGRSAELVIDESNPYLHRRLGRFYNSDGVWMLHNTGSTITLTMADTATASRLVVVPGARVAIPFEDCRLRFDVQGANYELDIDVPFTALESTANDTVSGTATVRVGNVPLTESQKQCIVALAEKRLINPAAAINAVPPNKDVYTRLGWTQTKFNRKLDNVCEKLSKSGVQGLQGGQGSQASRRRERLVDHAISTGLVSISDLDILP